jgi:hypothetical protein
MESSNWFAGRWVRVVLSLGVRRLFYTTIEVKAGFGPELAKRSSKRLEVKRGSSTHSMPARRSQPERVGITSTSQR